MLHIRMSYVPEGEDPTKAPHSYESEENGQNCDPASVCEKSAKPGLAAYAASRRNGPHILPPPGKLCYLAADQAS
jgi:hypothetical protein